MLTAVNDALTDDLGGNMFVTISYAILDPANRNIVWARGGHSPTIHFNAHTKELTEVPASGMIVGMKSGPLFGKTLKTATTQLRSGDLFLVYTDGVTETRNRQDEEYQIERLNDFITQHGGNVSVEELLDRLLDSIRSFRGGLPVDDDVTLLALAVD